MNRVFSSGELLPLVRRHRHHQRHLSTVVDLAHLASPVDLNHLSSIRSTADLLDSYTVTPPVQPWPSPLTNKRLASLVRRLPSPDQALAAVLHAHRYPPPGFVLDYPPFNALLYRLASARAFHLLPPALSALRRSALRPPEDTFVAIIRAFAFASRPAAALRTFLSIPSYGIRVSARSFNTLLNGMVQNRRFRLVALLFRNCQKKFGIVPNLNTCNILVKALCKLGDVDRALRVVDDMPGWGLVPNVVTYTTILAFYCSRGDLASARVLFDLIISKGWTPDVITYTVLVDGYCRQGGLVEAVKIMDEMEAAGITPNDVTYSVVIEACCKEKKPGEALNLISDMLDGGHVPSSSLCCKVIDVLCEDGKADDAFFLWKKLLKKNVMPDNCISSTLIYWLCKEGKVWNARKLFDDFEKGFSPSLLTYNTLISGMCDNGELQEAGRLWDDMVERKCMPNEFTYNVLIKGFCKADQPKEGIHVLEEMIEKGFVPNKLTYAALVDKLHDIGQENEVERLLLSATSCNGKFLDADSWDVIVRKFAGDAGSSKGHLDLALGT